MKKRTERMIQKACLEWLKFIEKTELIYYFRAGAGAMQTMQGRYFKTGRPGLPDIVLLVGSTFVGLEVKTTTGRQSQAQKKAEADIIRAGGEYYIIRSVSDLKDVLKKKGVKCLKTSS